MSTQPQIMCKPLPYALAQWLRLLSNLPLPLSTCSQRCIATILSYFLVIACEVFNLNSSFNTAFDSTLASVLPFSYGNLLKSRLYAYFLPGAEASTLLTNPRCLAGIILVVIGLIFLGMITMRQRSHQHTDVGYSSDNAQNSIRHPYLTALSICGSGALLLWPRYLVLAMFIAMLFACYFFARIKESESRLRYGQSYIEYKQRSGMFLPFPIPFSRALPRLPRCGLKRFMAIFGIYTLTTFVTFSLTIMILNH